MTNNAQVLCTTKVNKMFRRYCGTRICHAKKPERFRLNIRFNKKITIHDIGDVVRPKKHKNGVKFEEWVQRFP
jgi:hypothetical protein